ncbi:MAG TPA: acyltransferase [Ferruginibacter sp.]|nr:acyltransferase [Ferruginibacter sp.]HRE62391.1 acyltransferase [Ferruginibacter sp.]
MIHPLADVKSKNIGDNTSIWQFAIVLEAAQIGNNCNINCHTFIENDVVIGDRVTIKAGVFLWDGIRIANNVFIGPNVSFTNDKYPRSKKYPDKFQLTIIEEGVSIGANATILGGLTIGKFALIGAGSVVTKNIPPYSLVYGNPAAIVGRVNELGEIIEKKN